MQSIALHYQLAPPHTHRTNAAKNLTTLGNFISLPAWPLLTPILPSICGATKFPRRQPHSIYSVSPASIRTFPPKPRSTAPTISIDPPLHHLELVSLSMKPRPSATPGPFTALTTGTLAQLLSTSDATASMYRPRPPNTSPRSPNSPPPQLHHAPNVLSRRHPTRRLQLA